MFFPSSFPFSLLFSLPSSLLSSSLLLFFSSSLLLFFNLSRWMPLVFLSFFMQFTFSLPRNPPPKPKMGPPRATNETRSKRRCLHMPFAFSLFRPHVLSLSPPYDGRGHCVFCILHDFEHFAPPKNKIFSLHHRDVWRWAKPPFE